MVYRNFYSKFVVVLFVSTLAVGSLTLPLAQAQGPETGGSEDKKGESAKVNVSGELKIEPVFREEETRGFRAAAQRQEKPVSEEREASDPQLELRSRHQSEYQGHMEKQRTRNRQPLNFKDWLKVQYHKSFEEQGDWISEMKVDPKAGFYRWLDMMGYDRYAEEEWKEYEKEEEMRRKTAADDEAAKRESGKKAPAPPQDQPSSQGGGITGRLGAISSELE